MRAYQYINPIYLLACTELRLVPGFIIKGLRLERRMHIAGQPGLSIHNFRMHTNPNLRWSFMSYALRRKQGILVATSIN